MGAAEVGTFSPEISGRDTNIWGLPLKDKGHRDRQRGRTTIRHCGGRSAKDEHADCWKWKEDSCYACEFSLLVSTVHKMQRTDSAVQR